MAPALTANSNWMTCWTSRMSSASGSLTRGCTATSHSRRERDHSSGGDEPICSKSKMAHLSAADDVPM